MRRDVQLSMVEGLERPIGPIPESVVRGSNADLICSIAPIYLTGSVLDLTYGQGVWWQKYRPADLTCHDLALDGVDCRSLPHAAGQFDTVVFDPPYIHSSSGSTTRADFGTRYGVGPDFAYTVADIKQLLAEGTREACRVARRFVLVKCMEYVANHRFTDFPTLATNAARESGWYKYDQIVHYAGSGPGMAARIREVKRTRRAHSYLLVFAP